MNDHTQFHQVNHLAQPGWVFQRESFAAWQRRCSEPQHFITSYHTSDVMCLYIIDHISCMKYLHALKYSKHDLTHSTLYRVIPLCYPYKSVNIFCVLRLACHLEKIQEIQKFRQEGTGFAQKKATGFAAESSGDLSTGCLKMLAPFKEDQWTIIIHMGHGPEPHLCESALQLMCSRLRGSTTCVLESNTAG